LEKNFNDLKLLVEVSFKKMKYYFSLCLKGDTFF